MAVVTFWNDDREQSGKTLSAVAVATMMAIERNFKILLLSTSCNDSTMKNCYWMDSTKKNTNKDLFGRASNNIAVENGIEGLTKLISSNKIQPSIITDYTRVIFKGRLEVLNGYTGLENNLNPSEYSFQKVSELYPELIKIANQYYDMVIVDLDKNLNQKIKDEILEITNVNVFVFTQRLSSLNRYNNLKISDPNIQSPKCIPLIGKYDKDSKYNKKNIMRYLGIKKDLNVLPYNRLFFEAAEEASVTELFLKQRNIKDTTDDTHMFINEVIKLDDNIVQRVQELQKRMR